MTPAANELQGFHQFLSQKLTSGPNLSPEEALDLWRAEHPIPEDLDESVAAVRAALADMAAGDTGRPANDVIADLRARHSLEKRG